MKSEISKGCGGEEHALIEEPHMGATCSQMSSQPMRISAIVPRACAHTICEQKNKNTERIVSFPRLGHESNHRTVTESQNDHMVIKGTKQMHRPSASPHPPRTAWLRTTALGVPVVPLV